jgi:acyl-CoA synthetase (AMP-forming)/AMP-acid ligase II
MQTLTEWLAAGQDTNTCLSASGAAPLTYAGLRKLASYVEHSLNAVGIGRNDRVALVLPNSAEMAASFVTVAACTTSAPLNPAYRADEFEFYLNDLNAQALIVEAGSSTHPAPLHARRSCL